MKNVLRVESHRAFGSLVFEPRTAPGEYYVYYLPFKTEGPWYFPTTKYLPPSHTADAAWAAKAKPIVERIRQGQAAAIPAAKVVEFQAINDFHRFDPMEVIATADETQRLLAAHRDRPYLLFPEDRKYPIRMTDDLPLRWIKAGPSAAFTGDPCRGEFYVFQIGLYASGAPSMAWRSISAI